MAEIPVLPGVRWERMELRRSVAIVEERDVWVSGEDEDIRRSEGEGKRCKSERAAVGRSGDLEVDVGRQKPR